MAVCDCSGTRVIRQQWEAVIFGEAQQPHGKSVQRILKEDLGANIS